MTTYYPQSDDEERALCEAAARAEEAAGDPDCTTGQPATLESGPCNCGDYFAQGPCLRCAAIKQAERQAMTPSPIPPPSAEPEVAQIRARLTFRIHGLANRGAEICPAYVLPAEGDVCCARCGYRDDVHLLRDALALVDQLQREQARLRAIVKSEPLLMEMACPRCQTTSVVETTIPIPIGVLTATGSETHAQIRSERDVLRAEVERLTRELAEARDWSDMVTRGKSPCGHWKCYAHTEDGGKLIQCWQCRAEATEAKLAQPPAPEPEKEQK